VLSAVYRQATAVFSPSWSAIKVLFWHSPGPDCFSENREPHVLGSIFCIFHARKRERDRSASFLNYKRPACAQYIYDGRMPMQQRTSFCHSTCGSQRLFREDERPKRWTLWHRIAHSQGAAAAAIRGDRAPRTVSLFQYTEVTHFAPVSIQFHISKKALRLITNSRVLL
jgi:hypothetical protein